MAYNVFCLIWILRGETKTHQTIARQQQQSLAAIVPKMGNENVLMIEFMWLFAVVFVLCPNSTMISCWFDYNLMSLRGIISYNLRHSFMPFSSCYKMTAIVISSAKRRNHCKSTKRECWIYHSLVDDLIRERKL